MYNYKGTTSDGQTSMSKQGTLVSLLRIAGRNYQRLGMVGQIFRPDGTELRGRSRKITLPLELVFRQW